MVKELRERFAAGFGIVCGVGQLLQIFNAAEGLRRSFGLKGFDVAGAIDDEADQFGKSGGIAGGAKGRLLASDFFRVRFRSEFPGLEIETCGASIFRHGEKRALGLRGKGRKAASVEQRHLVVAARQSRS